MPNKPTSILNEIRENRKREAIATIQKGVIPIDLSKGEMYNEAKLTPIFEIMAQKSVLVIGG